jgi:hypothetical protein
MLGTCHLEIFAQTRSATEVGLPYTSSRLAQFLLIVVVPEHLFQLRRRFQSPLCVQNFGACHGQDPACSLPALCDRFERHVNSNT